MKITGIRSFMARDGERPRVIVAVDTDEGITDWAEAYNHGPDRALAPIFDYLVHQIAGEDPRRIERLYLKMLQHARFPLGALGLADISSLDHALWDISAKALRVPVYRLLGGHVRDYWAAAAAADHCGLTAFKLSPYRADIHAAPWGKVIGQTVTWVEAVTGLCPDYEFAFDAHARIYEPWRAMALGNALAPFHPLFFEEPIRPGWGAQIDEDDLKTDRYVHWERKLPLRPDGSTGYT